MPARPFADTNVLLYLYSEDEPEKRARARALVQDVRPWVSTQVLGEMANVLRRKFGLDYAVIGAVIAEIRATCHVVTVTPDQVAEAIRLAERYRLGYYDSLILATALSAGCETVFSEDMHDGHAIDGKLTVCNPFA